MKYGSLGIQDPLNVNSGNRQEYVCTYTLDIIHCIRFTSYNIFIFSSFVRKLMIWRLNRCQSGHQVYVPFLVGGCVLIEHSKQPRSSKQEVEKIATMLWERIRLCCVDFPVCVHHIMQWNQIWLLQNLTK